MRKLIALTVLLIAALFTAQTAMASAAAYGGCCLGDCKGMACAATQCAMCQLPAVTTAEQRAPLAVVATVLAPAFVSTPFAAVADDIWTPPD